MSTLKVTIHKENAIGERLQFELAIPYDAKRMDETHVYEACLPVFRAMDRRQFELNLRVLTINRQSDLLTPEEYGKFRNLLAAFNNILIEQDVPAVAQAEVVPADNNGPPHA
jgi:hypothetical protein